MSKLKTRLNNASVKDFLETVEDEQKKKEAFEILKIMEDITKCPPKMWGNSIVGFDSYHYKSDRSTQEGDWPIVGFSPRKNSLTIYIMPGFKEYKSLMRQLGKHKTGSSCLYVKKLEDVDQIILKKLIKQSVEDMREKYPKK